MAADIFAKLGDIKGESLDAKHKDEIEVLSFSWGVSNAGSMNMGGGAGTGRANFHDMSFVHKVDKASPTLMKYCATGVHLPSGVITHRKAGKTQQEFMIFKLTEIYITGVSQGGSHEGDNMENVSLQASKIEYEYKAQKGDGSLDGAVTFKYDVKGNKEG